MWLYRVETKLVLPMGNAYLAQHAVEFYAETRKGQVHSELRKPAMAQFQAGFETLEGILADGRKYLCGDRFTLADIRFYCLYNFFAENDAEQAAGKGQVNLLAYISRIKARPAATNIGPQARL